MGDKNIQTITVVLSVRDEKSFAAAEALTFGPELDARDYRVLSDGRAFEFSKAAFEPEKLQAKLMKRFKAAGLQADICVQKSGDRKKKLLICDMDSTLIGQECIDELADFAGLKPRISEITERAMRGEIEFDAALKARVSLLENLPLTALQECYESRIRLNKGARILARTMSVHGAKTIIVSGGFTYFTSRIAALAGFDHDQANILLDNGKALTGAVQMPILGREAKRQALIAHSADLGGPHTALAIGDGANDLAMIQEAGLGIAYYAKPAVAAAAHCAIAHTDLTTALYYQGYSDSDFIRD